MGKFKFRLSDMMPNAWFYKLKDMGKTKNHSISTKKKQQIESSNPKHQTQFPPYPRKSFYFSRKLVSHDKFSNSPPRKSSRRIRSLKIQRASPKIVSSSVSAGCRCRTKPESLAPECSASYSSDGDDVSSELELGKCSPEFRTDRILTPDSFDDTVKWSRSDTKDIAIDVERIDLPPIIAKPEQYDEPIKFHRNLPGVNKKEGTTTKERRKSTSRSPGMKLRINNSPRIGSRRFQASRKSGSSSSSTGSGKSLSESLAVVKSSFDPQRDFRESMVDMIVQNNIRASKDLEDLLACYLTLNSDEYHDLIIKVFKQIWFELSNHARIK